MKGIEEVSRQIKIYPQENKFSFKRYSSPFVVTSDHPQILSYPYPVRRMLEA